MLRTSVCLLAGARLGAAQGSLSDDVAVLLAFKAHGNNAQAPGLDTWVSGGDPCGAGFDHANSGFAHVMCCDAYSSGGNDRCTSTRNIHRVTYLDLSYLRVDGDLAGFAGLTWLTNLYLVRTSIGGDVSELAGLTHLSTLYLQDSAVGGDVSGLAGLTQLSILWLIGTSCYGDITVLRSSIPGIDANWDTWQVSVDFCSSSHYACPTGRTPVSSPDTYVGSNACACCSGTQKLLDSGTGACVDPGA